MSNRLAPGAFDRRDHLKRSRISRRLADRVIDDLISEILSYPTDDIDRDHHDEPGDSHNRAGIAVPLRLKDPAGVTLSFVSTTTVFGTPVEITLSELVLEAFYPADEATAKAILGART
jgi:MmyB-like transcription regulator ligand binding domain